MKTNPRLSLLLVSLSLSITLMAITTTGCRSAGTPVSASFASVVITNPSIEQIQDATMLVFGEAGYKAKRLSGGTMIFEKEGTRGNQIVYGGLGGAAYAGTITVRVQAEIVDLAGPDVRRLQCTAYMVSNAGEGVFEDPQRLANFHRKPYQKLLDAVAQRLK